MPRLILLNGPPGCGKSTLSQLFVQDHPLSLKLDIDVVRGLLGGWEARSAAAGLLARDLAVAMAGTHLAHGLDVVVPQYLGRLEFIERLERVAAETETDFREIVLMDSRDNAVRRFRDRGPGPSPAELEEMYDRLVALLASRPRAQVLPTEHGRVEEAYARVRACLGAPAG